MSKKLVFLIILFQICFSSINYDLSDIFLDQINSTGNNYMIESLKDNETVILNPGFSKTYLIQYQKDTNFVFNIENNEKLQINIHSLNCYFEIEFRGKKLYEKELEEYSIKIDSENNNITIKPLIDVINGKYKENYEKKSCPISINSILLQDDQPKLQITNQEENIFYFDYSKLNISYQCKEILEDSFVALYFQFNEKSNFSIDVYYQKEENETSSLTKHIRNSSYIYLDYKFLKYKVTNVTIPGGNLSIAINNKDNKNILMHLKIIEKESFSQLQKDYLNMGFITSKTTHQYYFMEVLKGEEGEFMLHNKRLHGVLYGRIVDKKNMSIEDLYDSSKYPKNDTNGTNMDSIDLKYNQNLLRMNFSYENTSHCLNGCYLLVTFEQVHSEKDFPLIGYEFTILTRFWNYTDYVSQIIDIPFNEYIIGAFESGSISHHYFSVSIPNDAKKIIIQIESNYLDGFYGEGKIKINTAKTIGNTKSLGIINNQHVLTLDVDELKYKEKIISFTFRPKDYYAEIFSFYYFRVLYIRENEVLYYPVDSNLGNLCYPEFDNNTKLYYCRLIYLNSYNDLSTQFAISSSIQNEYFMVYNIRHSKDDGEMSTYDKRFIYLSYGDVNGFAQMIFLFEFQNGELKNILSCMRDTVKNVHPHIYSAQMFYVKESYKTNHFEEVSNYTFLYQYVHGNAGNVKLSFLGYENFISSRNYKGLPLSVDIDSANDKITCSTQRPYYVYYIRLRYNMRNKGIEEIKSGETLNKFVIGGHFPIYYYLKVKNESYINVDLNLRINSYNESMLQNDFLIRSYVLDEDTIKRKINGEYINLRDPIPGNYLSTYKIGLLQVNKPIEENKNYILIEISNNEQNNINSYLLVQLITKEYNNEIYFMPVNHYIIDTFDGENNEPLVENKYYLCSEDKDEDQVLLEMSSGFDDIEIKFDNYSRVKNSFHYYDGFKRYRIYTAYNENVYFSVVNPKKRNANYMMRYYFTGIGGEYEYYLNDDPVRDIIERTDDTVSISLTFNSMVIKKIDSYIKVSNIYFYIYGFLFKPDQNTDEYINTTSILSEKKSTYVNNTIHFYNYTHPQQWQLIFKNIPKVENYIYDLQLQVNVILSHQLFNEEFLIFTKKIDLTDIKDEEKTNYTWIIVGVVIGVVVILLVVFFIIKYLRLKKSNLNLKEDLKSMAYSNDIQKNVINKEKQKSEKETDYDSTFI